MVQCMELWVQGDVLHSATHDDVMQITTHSARFIDLYETLRLGKKFRNFMGLYNGRAWWYGTTLIVSNCRLNIVFSITPDLCY